MGFYNLQSDSSGTSQYFVYRNNSEQIWKSGEWNEESKTFQSVPEMRLNYIFNYSYISNENESYFTYSLYNSSIISRFVIDFSGRIQQLTWSETTQRWNLFWSQPKLCDVYGICGPFGNCNQQDIYGSCECLPGFAPRSPTDWSLKDSSGGCVRSTPLQCGSEDGFSPIPTSGLPDKPLYSEIDSAEECKSACEATCSCNAYAFDYRCQLWDGDIINFNNITSSRYATTVFNLRLAATDIRSPSPVSSSLVPVSTAAVRKRKVIVWKIVVPVFFLVASVMGVIGYIYLLKRNKANKTKRERSKAVQGVSTGLLKSKATYDDTQNTNMFDDGKTNGESQELQMFGFTCLANATNNFGLTNKLGEGGFGPVYKGKLQNEQQIAVKRLSKNSGQEILSRTLRAPLWDDVLTCSHFSFSNQKKWCA
ncbi:G-type lectin S-receptor-like serine/threonine-protein kinase At2g19130 isoform X1 [Papaver somniferum]|uniref:G-type lectin S-receptor-like serine/threonine-protein kinase At2g19130 isoform X1 n=1 Tax=Papaver somniferum TaxID=3469 RepID=UPI000E701247|nr:G-type lectin S-receptor-like serine/threonine-protein kinase At2g19130 isoform X1 [Papaver somniferum]XP_026412785.1 G-type lectin S-receptor-like serine/threonine-protein kinase At2g19130 isoform X1 [Papaver somniferum]XP_026412786.1 G-type lectin S-receptor-like serine/threonine-protein kinase At2g19130 isoform X1 [Papaver somniferum]